MSVYTEQYIMVYVTYRPLNDVNCNSQIENAMGIGAALLSGIPQGSNEAGLGISILIGQERHKQCIPYPRKILICMCNTRILTIFLHNSLLRIFIIRREKSKTHQNGSR
jgi:hypothetical protein